MSDVKLTERAEQQLADLHDYIELRSGSARADAYINRILDFCERLKVFPRRSQAQDDIFPGLRTIPFEHRVVVAYFVNTDDSVLIEGIFYGGQDIEAAFRQG